MREPLVSVYMSVRNGGPYLAHAINSVREQVYQNWELIIVDDGSTDETVDYLKCLALECDWIKVVFTEGVGRARALNLAVSHAAGEYIANLDADDLYHPIRLRTQIALMQRHGLDFLGSTALYIKGEGSVHWKCCNVEKCTVDDRSKKLLRKNPVNHSSIMMSKELFYSVGGYNEALPSQIDYELWYRICLAGNPISVASVPLIAKRLHKGQSFERGNRIKYILNSYKVQSMVISGLNGQWYDRFFMFTRLLRGLVPAKIRLSQR
ncbi:glycosyltransferase [Halomonas sp. M5N1S17]|uniref:glycosyltransferase family 2 protein n=1 Tax=Halomonas alkalisoli TaxID=2907158 RepID=UPI001F1810F6|nr:glycosyltransferase [Halomonas alkalisoli]MCE9662749.1 glycosyltransferase [Halomonas alkalisoli]